MQKPEPRDEFANEADELEHTPNCMCWLVAEDCLSVGVAENIAALDLGLTQEALADRIKQRVLEGSLKIDVHPDGQSVRLIPVEDSA